MESLVLLVSAMDTSVLVAYTAITIMAIVPIYIGSHRSLNQKVVMQDGNKHKHKRRLYDSRVLIFLFSVLCLNRYTG